MVTQSWLKILCQVYNMYRGITHMTIKPQKMERENGAVFEQISIEYWSYVKSKLKYTVII